MWWMLWVPWWNERLLGLAQRAAAGKRLAMTKALMDDGGL
jgi:hypothetical protein